MSYEYENDEDLTAPMEVLVDLRTVPLKLVRKDGQTAEYTIRELDGDARDKYMNKLSSRMRFIDGKPAGFKSFNGNLADLIMASVLTAEGEPITLKEVQKWPAGTQEKVCDRIRKLSGMDKDAEARAKND